MKRRVHFNSGEIVGIKLQPVRLRQIAWVKDTAPVFEGPGARTDPDFLLVDQIQMEAGNYSFLSVGKDVGIRREDWL